MAKRPTVNTNDLPAEIRKQLGIKAQRRQSFTKETVRSHALRCLASLAKLTQDQRRRVLEHALKVNRM